MMRALIVDDEPLACAELAAQLLEVGQLAVVGKCLNAIEAIQIIRRERPDVLFLDVEYQDFGAGASRDDRRAMIALATRCLSPPTKNFAVQAFEKSATDYLLKPVQKERLARTMERLREDGARVVYNRSPAPAIRRVPCLYG